MSTREPVAEHGKRLRAEVSEERWRRIVDEADERAAVMDTVTAHREAAGLSWRESVATAAPEVPWPTFVYWRRHYKQRTGPTWERLLDGRVPPDTSIPEDVELAACLLRQLDPDIGVAAARKHLVRRFGEHKGHVSDTWLKRVWHDAGLNRPAGATGGKRHAGMEVEQFHGGAGLALLGAAEAELGTTRKLAEAMLAAGKRNAEAQGSADAVDDTENRDERGRFTADYNKRRRADTAPGEADARWGTDASKAARRDLTKLRTVRSKPAALTGQLLAMGATPLLTERRGFDGLDGPAGEWLGVWGGTAWMPTTLDKRLAELSLLDVGDDAWRSHTASWSKLTERWRAEDQPSWIRSVVYVDGTADPYWTRMFAASGKVSRVGRVMPCLTRIAIHSGRGVPLLVETHAGAASLKKRLLPMLERLDRAVGPTADVDRLTLVDSELGTAGSVWAMHAQTGMLFVTVLKGATLDGAAISGEGPWQDFRERDQVRNVEVLLKGKGAPAEGFRIRGVQMHRADGRRPQSTVFATNAHGDDLSPVEVASWYRHRWPRQEQHCATGRNGGGLNRSHGYGGEYVTYVALQDKQARAERSVAHAAHRRELAEQTRDELAGALAEAPARTRKQVLTLADRALAARDKEHRKREKTRTRVDTLPGEIYVRDTRRDSIMTCLKLNVLSLLEFVMQEYFGGVAMTWRTFIEQFVALPVEVRSNKRRCVYAIKANRRQPERMAQLRRAVEEINGREIRRGKQLLVFELCEDPETG